MLSKETSTGGWTTRLEPHSGASCVSATHNGPRLDSRLSSAFCKGSEKRKALQGPLGLNRKHFLVIFCRRINRVWRFGRWMWRFGRWVWRFSVWAWRHDSIAGSEDSVSGCKDSVNGAGLLVETAPVNLRQVFLFWFSRRHFPLFPTHHDRQMWPIKSHDLFILLLTICHVDC